MTAGPPLGMSSWTTQLHQLSGTVRPASGARSNTRATDIGEPGLTSTVQASKSSWQTASQCTSTTVPNQPFTVMPYSFGAAKFRSVLRRGAVRLGTL